MRIELGQEIFQFLWSKIRQNKITEHKVALFQPSIHNVFYRRPFEFIFYILGPIIIFGNLQVCYLVNLQALHICRLSSAQECIIDLPQVAGDVLYIHVHSKERFNLVQDKCIWHSSTAKVQHFYRAMFEQQEFETFPYNPNNQLALQDSIAFSSVALI